MEREVSGDTVVVAHGVCETEGYVVLPLIEERTGMDIAAVELLADFGNLITGSHCLGTSVGDYTLVIVAGAFEIAVFEVLETHLHQGVTVGVEVVEGALSTLTDIVVGGVLNHHLLIVAVGLEILVELLLLDGSRIPENHGVTLGQMLIDGFLIGGIFGTGLYDFVIVLGLLVFTREELLIAPLHIYEIGRTEHRIRVGYGIFEFLLVLQGQRHLVGTESCDTDGETASRIVIFTRLGDKNDTVTFLA